MDAWNGIFMGFIDPEHLRKPTQEYQDILVVNPTGRQECTDPFTSTDDCAMLFNYDVTVNKLAK